MAWLIEGKTPDWKVTGQVLGRGGRRFPLQIYFPVLTPRVGLIRTQPDFRIQNSFRKQ